VLEGNTGIRDNLLEKMLRKEGRKEGVMIRKESQI
jgi:hypothetical protein